MLISKNSGIVSGPAENIEEALMQIEITRAVIIDGEIINPGELIELKEFDAMQIISSGKAKRAESVIIKNKKKGKKNVR